MARCRMQNALILQSTASAVAISGGSDSNTMRKMRRRQIPTLPMEARPPPTAQLQCDSRAPTKNHSPATVRERIGESNARPLLCALSFHSNPPCKCFPRIVSTELRIVLKQNPRRRLRDCNQPNSTTTIGWTTMDETNHPSQ